MRRVYRRELKFRLEDETEQGKGMFLVMTTNAIAPLIGLVVGELSSFCLLFLAVNHSKAGNRLGLGVGLVLGLGIGQG